MEIAALKGHPVYRVGRFPDPWAWAEPQYSGRNRWDDADGNFRTLYAGDSLYGCFVETLAYARPDHDPDGSDPLHVIDEDDQDAEHFPTPAAGIVPADWLGARMKASGELTGEYADVTSSTTVADLRPSFLRLAHSLGFPDFDTAALKLAHPRELTQRVATRLYTVTDSEGDHPLDGVRFASRHGDELVMWAIFERPDLDTDSSRLINLRRASAIDKSDPELVRAMELHHLTFGDD